MAKFGLFSADARPAAALGADGPNGAPAAGAAGRDLSFLGQSQFGQKNPNAG